MLLNIDSDAVVKFTKTLETLHKSALPLAIRGALNDAAFDVKKNTMPQKAKDTFIKRASGDFFKANSRVESATGFDVKTMKSTVGMISMGLKYNRFSVSELEQQEHGGKIGHRTFIPTIFSRKGNSKNGMVKPNLRLKLIRNKIIKSSKETGSNEKEKYIKAVVKAGVGGFVLYHNMVWRIDSFPLSSIRTKSLKIKRTPIYSVHKGRGVSIKQTNFMKTASLESNKKMEIYYIAQAKKQIERLSK